MAVLKGTLKASSLIEVMVASVILLTVFVLTLEILIPLSLRGRNLALYGVVENEIRRQYGRIVSCQNKIGREEKHSFYWGELQVEYRDYSERTVCLRIKASIKGEKTELFYEYLLPLDEEVR